MVSPKQLMERAQKLKIDRIECRGKMYYIRDIEDCKRFIRVVRYGSNAKRNHVKAYKYWLRVGIMYIAPLDKYICATTPCNQFIVPSVNPNRTYLYYHGVRWYKDI